MASNRYYYYDHKACAFVEVKQRPYRLAAPAAAVLVLSLLMTGVAVLGMTSVLGTPREQALLAENEALARQLTLTQERMGEFSDRLEKLAESDRKLYRALLQADPISEEVRQVGVGGTDAYADFDRYGGTTTSLLRRTAQHLDKIERQINLQGSSYRDLFKLSVNREEWLAQMPAILPGEGALVSGFGVRRHPIYKTEKMHHGIDLVMDIGTPVYATGDGVVVSAGPSSGYGLGVELSHPRTGYRTFYAHLSKVMPKLRPGTRVKRGDQIAFSGNTGRSTGAHLHYEVRNARGETLNPVQFFAPSMTPQEYRRAVAAAANSTTALD